MNYDMNQIQSWLSANQGSLKCPKKQKFMLIGSHYKLSYMNKNFSVKVNDASIERVVEHKYLGVQTYERLKWHSHVIVITKKISAGLEVLKRISPLIPCGTRMNMYNALVMPYFNYCGTVWGNIGRGLADKIQKLQNWAARILTFSKVRSNVLLDVLGWESLEASRLKQLTICM